MNGERIYFSDQNLNSDQQSLIEGTNTHFMHTFKTFLNEFTRENIRVYSRQIENIVSKKGDYVLQVELSDLKAFEEHLYEKFMINSLEMLKVMEEATRIHVREQKSQLGDLRESEWQVTVRSDEIPKKIRDVTSSMVSKLMVISGIIISTTKPYIKASKLKLKCRNCMAVKIIELAPGQYPWVPSFCSGQG